MDSSFARSDSVHCPHMSEYTFFVSSSNQSSLNTVESTLFCHFLLSVSVAPATLSDGYINTGSASDPTAVLASPLYTLPTYSAISFVILVYPST
jgi:hypothetical protein